MAVETLIAESFIQKTLANDATLTALLGGSKVYNELAPSGTQTPYIVFRYRSSRDVRGNGPTRTATSFVYLVEAITNKSFSDIASIVSRADELLQGASGTSTGGRTLGVVRLMPWKLLEPQSDGTFFKRLGGEYRIDVQGT